MGRLTTHVLDTAHGRPGAGIRIELYRLDGRTDGTARELAARDLSARNLVASATTNADGRCDQPLLEGAGFLAGSYELVFHAGTYFAGRGMSLPAPAFLDEVVIRFGVASAAEHYHVPLLLSPYGYSTYRGS
jgi:5-hydroxyisourate hydrolase